MQIEITEAEAAIIDAGLVARMSEYGRYARALRNRPARLLDSLKKRVAIADGVRRKLLVARYGEARAAEIVAERAKEPDAEELADGEPVWRDGVTCYGTAAEIPYCNGVNCPEWEDCHGDKLRGFSASASNWRENCRPRKGAAYEQGGFQNWRGAVAFSGGVWYNMRRFAAMGDRRPAPEREQRDNESFSAPRKRPTASRSIFYPFAGRGFCKWR